MDKIKKLKALTGEDEVYADTPNNWGYALKPAHIYEGTDSEDDELVTSRKFEKKAEPAGVGSPIHIALDGITNDFVEYKLQFGELAEENANFVPWRTVKKYPYCYIGKGNKDIVLEGFFHQGKIYDSTWDFFYIHRAPKDSNKSAILLVPTKQLEAFLGSINRKLQISLTMPAGAANGGFQVTFANDGAPRPRYLGRSTNKEMADDLKAMIPPSHYKLDGEPVIREAPSDRSLIAFKAKIDLMMQAQKGKKLANKEKQKVERIAKQQSWNHSIKRVQRYLGIREASTESQLTAIRAGLIESGLKWLELDAAAKAVAAKLPPSASFDANKTAPYKPEGSVVFICVDVEAYERNSSLITEIGIATLDTNDIVSLIPGESGVNWRSMIRARHFRINEYKHLNNTEFIDGCPDRFEFGESEFVSLKDAPQIVASCFKHPFSQPVIDSLPEEDLRRSIILVGHDVNADIIFLRKIGYEVHNLSNLLEVIDTASMWRYLKREANPRNLGSILAELDIIGWNLHNAGNDAVYTLQAMIGISIKHLNESEKRKETKVIREREKQNRVVESVKEAALAAWEKEEGWSSGGNSSDGGAPVFALSNSGITKRPAGVFRSSQSNYSEGPWRSMVASGNLQQAKKKSWDASASNAQSSKPAPHSTCLASLATQTSTQRRTDGGWPSPEESHSRSSRTQTQAKNEPNSGELGGKAAQITLGNYQPTENKGPYRRTGWDTPEEFDPWTPKNSSPAKN